MGFVGVFRLLDLRRAGRFATVFHALVDGVKVNSSGGSVICPPAVLVRAMQNKVLSKVVFAVEDFPFRDLDITMFADILGRTRLVDTV